MTGTRRVEQLLWELRDGDIAPADLAWLEARLDADPEAAAMAAEVAAVDRGLAEAAPAAEPAELGGRIRSALEGARPPRSGWRARRWPPDAPATTGPVASPLTWQRGWVYLAAGLIIGIGLALVLRRAPDLETRDLAGTASLSVESEPTGPRLALPEGRGSLALERRAASLTLSFEWAAAEPVELVLSGGGGLSASGPAPPAPATWREISAAVRILRLSGPGRATVEVTPRDPAAPIEIDVRAQGRSWARRSLRLEDLP